MAKATVIEAEPLETERETSEKDMNGVDGKYIVLPVYKALQVLMMLSERGKVTLKEVYLELGISKAQAFRYLQTLCASSFAEYDDETGLYHLGIRSWELEQLCVAR
jgi:Fic family protein